MGTKKWLYIIGITAIVALYLPAYIKLIQLRARNEELQSRIKGLKRQSAQYLEEIKKLKTDPVYVEKVAREKMGVVRKGEIVYKIVPEEQQTNPVKNGISNGANEAK